METAASHNFSEISGDSECKWRGSLEGEGRDRVMLSKRRITCYVTA